MSKGYTIEQAHADFVYIVESLKIAFGNASLRGDDTIDPAIVAAALTAARGRDACAKWLGMEA